MSLFTRIEMRCGSKICFVYYEIALALMPLTRDADASIQCDIANRFENFENKSTNFASK